MCKRCEEEGITPQDPTADKPIAERIEIKLGACVRLMRDCIGLVQQFGGTKEQTAEGLRLSPVLAKLCERYHAGDRTEDFEKDITKAGDGLAKLFYSLSNDARQIVAQELLGALLGAAAAEAEQEQAPTDKPVSDVASILGRTLN